MLNLILTATTKAFLFSCLLTTASPVETPTGPAKPVSFQSSLWITKDNKIRVAVEKSVAESVTISLRLKEAEQLPVFMQQIGKKRAKLALQLDVSDLADGVYELEIKSASGSVIKQINLGSPKTADLTRTIVMR